MANRPFTVSSIYWACFLFFLVGAFPAKAQLNFLSGYKYSYFKSDRINGYLNDYNETLTANADLFEPLNALHGFSLGASYNWEHVRIEALYNTSFNTRRTRARNINQELVNDATLFFGASSVSFGTEVHGKVLGLGATFEMGKMRIRLQEPNVVNPKLLLNDWKPASTFYLNLFVGSGSKVAISVRPFVQVFWSDFNLYPMANALAPNKHNNPLSGNYSFMPVVPGLNIFISNGRQY